jgi:hypothetical protein
MYMAAQTKRVPSLLASNQQTALYLEKKVEEKLKSLMHDSETQRPVLCNRTDQLYEIK